MKGYEIFSKSGESFGVYEADNKKQAFEAMKAEGGDNDGMAGNINDWDFESRVLTPNGCIDASRFGDYIAGMQVAPQDRQAVYEVYALDEENRWIIKALVDRAEWDADFFVADMEDIAIWKM